MSEAVRLQDSADVLEHTEDWSTFLGTDTIVSSSWTISPAGPDITSAPDTHTASAATVWIAGAAFGKVYELRNTIVTAAPRTARRSFVLRVARL